MLKFTVCILFFFALSGRSAAQQSPFKFISSHALAFSDSELTSLEEKQDKGAILDGGRALNFTSTILRIVVRSGPSDDMLSYRIQGFRNPTLGFRPGSEVHLLFANVDDDMHHDIRLGSTLRKFPKEPGKVGTVGTSLLPPMFDERSATEEVEFHVGDSGAFTYYCSETGHAAGGMWGNIAIGKNPQALIALASPQMPEKMSQEGSGTSWLPASSPIYASMYDINDWMLMLHGNIMPRYDHQGGPRGGEKFDAPNWMMAMLSNDVGTNGHIAFRGMFSLDPLTEGKGYPQLFQSGDTWQGKPLPDYKDPHNLFDELSATYSQRVADQTSAFLYFGYPGEPALGPPVFMHRPSAMSNSEAPISHDWMDGLHITFGVATAGVIVGNFKLEGSAFNGSAPSTNLYGIDKLRINSYSGRLSFNPSDDLAFQISRGYITNPDGDSVNVIRSSASAIYTQNYGGGSWWSTTLSWGENHAVNLEREEALLMESQYTIPDYTFFGRAEYIQKSDADLALSENRMLLHDLSYIAIGLTRTLFHVAGMDAQIGSQISYHFVPESLISLYSAHPISYEIFFAFHPSLLD